MRFATVFCLCGMLASAQQPPAQAPADSGAVLRTETRLVLVDTVVTDKKGNTVPDLAMKDFRVWEDNKEQTIKNFSFEADPASPSNSQKRYLVLFFDNSTMETGDQVRARQAAEKFIDGNTAPNRLMAVVNFGGTLRVAQNFTADADRLKKAVSGVKFSAVSPNAEGKTADIASAGMPRLGNAEADFGARSVMLALRSLAKNLASVPGRKTLVMFTAGFPLTRENMPEVTAVIDVCNRSNVAIYPIDVRGLVASAAYAPRLDEPLVRPISMAAIRIPMGSSFVPQRTGGGGGGGTTGGSPGGGTGTPVGGTGGGRGGTVGTPVSPGRGTGGGTTGNPGTGSRPVSGQPYGQPYMTSPYNQPRQIVPSFPASSSTNQQVLYQLAEGTGGFVIVNTNDLLGGLEKIAREQNEHYILGYTPSESPEGSCHTLRVKVDRGGTTVRARSGYCNARPVDLLAGNPVEKDLENRVAGTKAGNVNASMRVPFFYISPNTARVNVAMEIPLSAVNFEKTKGKFHASLNILGIAYSTDGAVAARFSDAVKLDFANKKEMEAAKEEPLHYENEFEIASGQYAFKIVFSSGGETFGKLETPLVIDPYDGKQFSLSALAMSKEVRAMHENDLGRDIELLEGRTPLATQGLQVIPTGTERFDRSGAGAIYVEIYEPGLLSATAPMVGIQIRLIDKKSGEAKHDSGLMNVAPWIRKDNAVIPVILKVSFATLSAGTYRAEVKAMNSTGQTSIVRAADFELQ